MPTNIDRLESSTLAAFVRGVILLNRSQTRVLAAALRGCHYSETASDLSLSLATVKLQLSMALKKLNSPSVLQAAIDLMRLSHLESQLTPEERIAAAALTSHFPEIEWNEGGALSADNSNVGAVDALELVPRPQRRKREYTWRRR